MQPLHWSFLRCVFVIKLCRMWIRLKQKPGWGLSTHNRNQFLLFVATGLMLIFQIGFRSGFYYKSDPGLDSQKLGSGTDFPGVLEPVDEIRIRLISDQIRNSASKDPKRLNSVLIMLICNTLLNTFFSIAKIQKCFNKLNGL